MDQKILSEATPFVRATNRSALFASLFLSVLMASACAPRALKPLRTQLEVRQIQSREYPKVEKNNIVMMKALINVLQDEGFIVRNAEKELGFIVASKETPIPPETFKWYSLFISTGDDEGRAPIAKLTESSVNLTEVGNQFKVRAVFQEKVLDNLGGTMSVEQIEDPGYYQDFFSKVDKSLYLERQKF